MQMFTVSLISLFRLTLFLSPLFAILSCVYTYVATPQFSQEWKDLLEWSGDGFAFGILDSGKLTFPKVAFAVGGLLFFLAVVANQVALFFFWRPSRTGFLILSIIGFGLIPFMGLQVVPPWEAFFYELSVFLSGVTLALAYFSPLSVKFEKQKTFRQDA